MSLNSLFHLNIFKRKSTKRQQSWKPVEKCIVYHEKSTLNSKTSDAKSRKGKTSNGSIQLTEKLEITNLDSTLRKLHNDGSELYLKRTDPRFFHEDINMKNDVRPVLKDLPLDLQESEDTSENHSGSSLALFQQNKPEMKQRKHKGSMTDYDDDLYFVKKFEKVGFLWDEDPREAITENPLDESIEKNLNENMEDDENEHDEIKVENQKITTEFKNQPLDERSVEKNLNKSMEDDENKHKEFKGMNHKITIESKMNPLHKRSAEKNVNKNMEDDENKHEEFTEENQKITPETSRVLKNYFDPTFIHDKLSSLELEIAELKQLITEHISKKGDNNMEKKVKEPSIEHKQQYNSPLFEDDMPERKKTIRIPTNLAMKKYPMEKEYPMEKQVKGNIESIECTKQTTTVINDKSNSPSIVDHVSNTILKIKRDETIPKRLSTPSSSNTTEYTKKNITPYPPRNDEDDKNYNDVRISLEQSERKKNYCIPASLYSKEDPKSKHLRDAYNFVKCDGTKCKCKNKNVPVEGIKINPETKSYEIKKMISETEVNYPDSLRDKISIVEADEGFIRYVIDEILKSVEKYMYQKFPSQPLIGKHHSMEEIMEIIGTIINDILISMEEHLQREQTKTSIVESFKDSPMNDNEDTIRLIIEKVLELVQSYQHPKTSIIASIGDQFSGEVIVGALLDEVINAVHDNLHNELTTILKEINRKNEEYPKKEVSLMNIVRSSGSPVVLGIPEEDQDSFVTGILNGIVDEILNDSGDITGANYEFLQTHGDDEVYILMKKDLSSSENIMSRLEKRIRRSACQAYCNHRSPFQNVSGLSFNFTIKYSDQMEITVDQMRVIVPLKTILEILNEDEQESEVRVAVMNKKRYHRKRSINVFSVEDSELAVLKEITINVLDFQLSFEIEVCTRIFLACGGCEIKL